MWRGRIMMGRGLPDTSLLSVGDTVVVTRIESSSEYFCLTCAAGELWFSMNNLNGAGDGSELWVLKAGELAATLVWLPPDNQEFIASIIWSEVDQNVYITTIDSTTPTTIHCYRMDQATYTETEIFSFSFAGANQANLERSAAEFHNSIYFSVIRAPIGMVEIRRFDPVAETQTTVFSTAFSVSTHFSVAVDHLADQIVASIRSSPAGTTNIWKSSTGDSGSWSLETTLDAFGEFESIDMITNRDDDDYLYSGGIPHTVGGSILMRRTASATWDSELTESDADEIGQLTQEYNGSGVAIALWAQGNSGTYADTIFFKKLVGSTLWTVDSILADFFSDRNCGPAFLNSLMYVLVQNLTSADVILYQRSAAGVWSVFQNFGPDYFIDSNMITIPATPRLHHEV